MSDIDKNRWDSESAVSDLNCSALVNDLDSFVLTNVKNIAGMSQASGVDNTSQKLDSDM